MKYLRTLLFFLNSFTIGTLYAQDSVEVYVLNDSFPSINSMTSSSYQIITSPWKYHPGDALATEAAWTSPGYNDSAWEKINSRLSIDTLPKSGWNGIGLFRLHLEVDSSLWDQPMAFNIIQMGASDIYLDGKLLYSYGKVGHSEKEESGLNTMARYPELITFTGRKHVIAVQFSSFATLHDRPPSITDLGFALAIGPLKSIHKQTYENVKFFRSLESLVIGIPLAFSLLHLLLFLFAGHKKPHFYFALFTFFIALWGVLEHEAIMTPHLTLSLVLSRLWTAYITLLPIIGIRFLYAVFYPKIPRYFWIFVIIGILLAIISWFISTTIYALIFFIASILEMFRIVIRAIRSKQEGAWIIGTGFITFGLSLIIVIITIGIFNYFSMLFFYGMIYLVGVLAVLISMSVYLSRNIASTTKNLEVQTQKSIDLELDNARKEIELEKADEIKAAYTALEEAHTTLQATQTQLIQSEKMASLGELTAGIAHEIQNPLNFVNNFSEVNTELIDEMKQELAIGNMQLADEIASNIKENEEKINFHGKRADSIVKGMLQHSRSSSGVKEPTDINALADEYLRLAYHGLRAKDKSFNATMKSDFDESIGMINVIPQDIGRVILNLITNAFYAVSSMPPRPPKGGETFVPTVTIKTRKYLPPLGGKGGQRVEVSVSDNGPGIPKSVVDKIFQPFFTTKPTGQGTGLGLSLSYDIVKAHGGELTVETEEGVGSTFIIKLPII